MSVISSTNVALKEVFLFVTFVFTLSNQLEVGLVSDYETEDLFLHHFCSQKCR